MNSKLSPLTIYQQHIEKYTQLLKQLQQKRSHIGWLRFAIVVLTAIAIYINLNSALWLIIAVGITGIASFLFILSRDADTKTAIANTETLLAINQEELQILAGEYYHRFDGAIYVPEFHAYANDLDIFGKASIYQYINRCSAQQGQQLLASNLLAAMPKEKIQEVQQAVKELTPHIAWRQQLQAFGLGSPLTTQTEKRIVLWLQEPYLFKQDYWKIIVLVFPVIPFTALLLYLVDIIDGGVFSLVLFACYLFAFRLSKTIHGTYGLLSGVVKQVTTIYRQLQHIEKEQWNSAYLQQIQQSVNNQQGEKPATSIHYLVQVLNRFDVRLNVFAFFFLNTFLLWDLRQLLALNRWKKENSAAIPAWFAAIAELEVLNSLACLSFNEPDWCFARIADHHFEVEAVDLGHPLIMKDKRVNNSFGINGIGKIHLITGSNMGGKSTFLRSVGVNAVLALMGAPVCATHFTISVVRIMSSMRIADNLAENTSTFYAELKKLKGIIEAVNAGEKVFILLDEMLRGTNSLDRYTGSKALITQLIKDNAVAIIATHDVELASMQTNYREAISNYHFDVQVANEELYFDYRLKEGVCTSMNASVLMKKIGIQL
jgi:hypothetical protein